MNDPTPPRTHPLALASLVLGLASVVLFAVTGIAAVWCGLRGLRAVNAGNGRFSGRRMALAGLALGAAGTLATLLGGAAILFIRLQENSRRVECTNNLRELGVALHKYATAHDALPAATRDPEALPPERRLSWMADILPMLGEAKAVNKNYHNLALKIDLTFGWDEPKNAEAAGMTVRAFLCRSHPHFRLEPVTHYVGLAGVGPDAAGLKRDDPRAGAFGHGRGVARKPGLGVGPKDMAGGITFTIVVLETAEDNGPWLAGGWPTVRDLAPGVDRYCGPGRPFGGMHHRVTNVLWGDGSVRPVGDDTPGELMRRQAVLRPGEPRVFAHGGEW